MSNRKLARNIGSMSIAVFISRIFGLARDILFAGFFGTTFVADAFNVGYQIPNLLRKLFGEGALSAAFIPIYSEFAVKKSRQEQIAFALNILSLLTFFLFVLSALGIIFAPLIVKLLAPGFDLETYNLTVKLTRIMFPYLLLIGLSSTLISILNYHNYFFIPGLSSAFLNVGMIIFLAGSELTGAVTPEKQVVMLSIGVLVGGILQTIVNFPLLVKIGYRIKLQFNIKSSALRNLWRRFLPGVLGLAIREINLIADIIIASFLVTGSIAALQYGNRLMQLPLGIIGISASSAVLPLFSKYAAEKQPAKLSESLRFSIVTLTYLMLPITAVIVAMGKDIISLLLMRGAFDDLALDMTYRALLFYSLGLLFYSLSRTLIPVFYAHKDTKTPVKISALIVVTNIILNLILMQFLQHAGLALASSLAAMIHTVILFFVLKRLIPSIIIKSVWSNVVKIIFMSLVVFILLSVVSPFFPAVGLLQLVLKLAVLISVSALIYYGGTYILKVEYVGRIFKVKNSGLAEK